MIIEDKPIKVEIPDEIKNFLKNHFNLIYFDHTTSITKGSMCFGHFYMYENRNGDTYFAKPFDAVVPSVMEFFKKEGLYDEYWKAFCSFLDKKEVEAINRFKEQNQ